jgi:hypothetical protein
MSDENNEIKELNDWNSKQNWLPGAVELYVDIDNQNYRPIVNYTGEHE